MMLPRIYQQSVLVTAAGFWASAIAGIVVYFAANLVAQKLGAPHQIENYAEAFAAPVAVTLAMLANVKVARKDFGFSGPINWMTTGFGLLLLGLAVFTTANFEKVDDNHHDCFHHSRHISSEVTF